MERRHKAQVLKIYPAAGKTSDHGHNLVYNSVPVWEGVFSSFSMTTFDPEIDVPGALQLPVPSDRRLSGLR